MAECQREIRDACAGPDWMESEACEKFDGGVDGAQVVRCVYRKLPSADRDLLEDCQL